MSSSDESAKTMRIDIHPDFAGETLARKRRETQSSVYRLPEDSQPAADAENCSGDYKKLLESIYDAVFVTDMSGLIVDGNSRASDFFMCDIDSLRGHNVINLISGSDTSLLDSIHLNLEDHRYTLIEAYCIRLDKSMFPAEIAVNRVDLAGIGDLCFFIRDISVRKRAQDALEEAVARLEEHDRARSQFVSNVSHELRTPLTSMTYAITNMLRGVAGDISDRLKSYLQMLDGDCKRLLGTVNDILDLRLIDTDTLTLSKAQVPFARLVDRSLQSFNVQAEQKMIELKMVVDSGPLFVNCDAHKMERVVLNIVGNAMKFTSDNGRVVVLVSDDPDVEGNALFQVTDTGIGIPEKALERVAERYFTVGEQPSGTGLGLSICKEIVNLHGGTLSIRSPAPGQDKGTQVTVSLPKDDAPTVLVVDDEEVVRRVLQAQLEMQGYRVVMAKDGQQALELAATEKPDVMLLDLVLPEIEGTEVILRMKGDETLTHIPIIVITGAHVGNVKAQVLNSFAIPALSKPWEEPDLLDRVEGALLGAASLLKKRQKKSN